MQQSLLCIREVEGLALQPQLQYKIENKFAVLQVSNKKLNAQHLLHTLVHEYAAGKLL